MPEGDTIALDALRLGPVLLGRPIRSARSRRLGRVVPLEGRTVTRLRCVGKNLLLCLDDGSAVRAHRRMTGWWQTTGRAPRSLFGVDLALQLDGPAHPWVVARDMPVLEVLRPGGDVRHPGLRSLGPDLLGLTVGPDGARPLPEPDWDAVGARIDAQPLRPLHELLLDQRVACGLGNVYKSELLFLHGLDPWARVAQVGVAAMLDVYRHGRRLLMANTRPGRRTTRGEGRTGATWVYGRAGQPCLRCGTPLRIDPGQGALPRLTVWCPTCQPPEAPDAAVVR